MSGTAKPAAIPPAGAEDGGSNAGGRPTLAGRMADAEYLPAGE